MDHVDNGFVSFADHHLYAPGAHTISVDIGQLRGAVRMFTQHHLR